MPRLQKGSIKAHINQVVNRVRKAPADCNRIEVSFGAESILRSTLNHEVRSLLLSHAGVALPSFASRSTLPYVMLRVRVRVRVRVGGGMRYLRTEKSQVISPPAIRVRVGGGMRNLRTEKSQVIPPPAFYCINHNQTHSLQSRE